ncbi:MAG: SDR family NAD(P)-dependent oxidoreductase [Actinomycetota bacterium]
MPSSTSSPPPIAGRRMLITGAGRGLGAHLARRATTAGYRVVGIDTDFSDLDADLGRNMDCCTGSVTDPAFVAEVLATHGPVDVVVNNAGIVRFGPLATTSLDDFRAVVDVNLTGTFIVSQGAAQQWIKIGRPGVIVNITSMNGVAAGPNAGAYGATKAAVALLTSQMAIEWGPHSIRVNAVAPGLIDAGMSEPIYADPATRQARESKVPLGRLGTADDIADVVLFVASDAAGYLHGQNIVVDGGVTGSVIAHLPRPASVEGGKS